jgi:hypothetical protein
MEIVWNLWTEYIMIFNKIKNVLNKKWQN